MVYLVSLLQQEQTVTDPLPLHKDNDQIHLNSVLPLLQQYAQLRLLRDQYYII